MLPCFTMVNHVYFPVCSGQPPFLILNFCMLRRLTYTAQVGLAQTVVLKRSDDSLCLNLLCFCTATGLAPSSRPDSHSTSEALTPTTPTSSGHNRLGGAPSVNIISGLASGPGMDHMKAGGLAGLLGPPPKAPRGRKKIKAENPSGPLLVVPYPILADQGCVTIAPKEGKTYRLDTTLPPHL